MGWGGPAARAPAQLITIWTGAGEDPGRTVLDQLFRAEKGGRGGRAAVSCSPRNGGRRGPRGGPRPVVHLGTGEGEGPRAGRSSTSRSLGGPSTPRVRTVWTASCSRIDGARDLGRLLRAGVRIQGRGGRSRPAKGQRVGAVEVGPSNPRAPSSATSQLVGPPWDSNPRGAGRTSSPSKPSQLFTGVRGGPRRGGAVLAV